MLNLQIKLVSYLHHSAMVNAPPKTLAKTKLPTLNS